MKTFQKTKGKKILAMLAILNIVVAIVAACMGKWVDALLPMSNAAFLFIIISWMRSVDFWREVADGWKSAYDDMLTTIMDHHADDTETKS